MNTQRVDEIVSAMSSFGKERYYKDELLGEMFALQQEMVGLTFNDEHAATAGLRIWDVEQHLEQMNQECGNVASTALEQFKAESREFSNLIRAEYCGSQSEFKTFQELENIRGTKRILKNIELNDGDARTEIDAVVITLSSITIVEVKGTTKGVYIDKYGNYYQRGKYQKWKCNLEEKMAIKRRLLEKVLSDTPAYRVPINSVVVFTDMHIEVENRHDSLTTCFLSELPDIIDGYDGGTILTSADMENIELLINQADYKEAYPFDFNVAQYKHDFAALMAILEDASAGMESVEGAQSEKEEGTNINETQEETRNETEMHDDNDFWHACKRALTSRAASYVGTAVAAAAVTLVTKIAIDSIKKGGF